MIGLSVNRRLSRNGLGGDQAGAEFSSNTLFPSRPLDNNRFVFVAGSVIRDQGALARVAYEQNAALRVRAQDQP